MWIVAAGAATGRVCPAHITHFLFLLNKRAPPLGMSTLAELIQPVRLPSRLMISYRLSSCVIVAPCARALTSFDHRARPRFPGLFYPIGPLACSLPSLHSTFPICVLLVHFIVSGVSIVDAATGPVVLPFLARGTF